MCHTPRGNEPNPPYGYVHHAKSGVVWASATLTGRLGLFSNHAWVSPARKQHQLRACQRNFGTSCITRSCRPPVLIASVVLAHCSLNALFFIGSSCIVLSTGSVLYRCHTVLPYAADRRTCLDYRCSSPSYLVQERCSQSRTNNQALKLDYAHSCMISKALA